MSARSADGARPPLSARAATILAILGLGLVALSLRTAVTTISPIADHIDADIGLGSLSLSVLGAVPPLAFATSGLFAPALVRRWGLERTLIAAIVVIAIGHLARSLAPDQVALIVATVITLVGVGVGNVLLPSLVTRYFADRKGPITAMYTTLMAVGTAAAAFVAVPIADSAGWRLSLGVWCILTVLAAPPWVALLAGTRQQRADEAERDAELPPLSPARPIWRSPTAIAIALLFIASSTALYAAFAWLPKLLVDTAGVTPAQAGGLLALVGLMGFPGSILAPMIAARMQSVAPLIVLSVVLFVAAELGLLFAPSSATLLWVLLYGLAPLLFPLSLYLVSARSRTHLGAVATSGFAQGVGYLFGAGGPLIVGALHDATGAWTAPLIYLIVIALVALPAAFLLHRRRYVEDELALPS